MTRCQLGERLGESQPAAARLENGDSFPRVGTLARRATALGVEETITVRPLAEIAVDWSPTGEFGTATPPGE
jgi:transcriptional regulator with XRE-family HTH domain